MGLIGLAYHYQTLALSKSFSGVTIYSKQLILMNIIKITSGMMIDPAGVATPRPAPLLPTEGGAVTFYSESRSVLIVVIQLAQLSFQGSVLM